MGVRKLNTVKALEPSRPVKHCGCGRTYFAPPPTAIVVDYEEFGLFYQFNCVCKSTLMIPIETRRVAC